MFRRTAIQLTVLAVLAASSNTRADEFHLKDGSKIVGTIVGYENDSFRVQTSYGFALVRKDKIAEIIPSTPAKDADARDKANAATIPDKQPVAARTARDDSSRAPTASSEPKQELSTAIPLPKPAAPPVIAAAKPPVIPAAGPLLAAPIVAADAPATPPAPPQPPMIHDEVSGNLYLNHTYNFQMYKPPSWDLTPEARSALPNAIAALGTYDQTTLLVIGLEPTKDTLDQHADEIEKTLGEIYDNYRGLSTRRTTIAGSTAIERRARGLLDKHDWSVTLLTFVHGNDTYTLLGMTYADDDLIQVQENVISKAMNSLTFIK